LVLRRLLRRTLRLMALGSPSRVGDETHCRDQQQCDRCSSFKLARRQQVSPLSGPSKHPKNTPKTAAAKCHFGHDSPLPRRGCRPGFAEHFSPKGERGAEKRRTYGVREPSTDPRRAPLGAPQAAFIQCRAALFIGASKGHAFYQPAPGRDS